MNKEVEEGFLDYFKELKEPRSTRNRLHIIPWRQIIIYLTDCLRRGATCCAPMVALKQEVR